MHKLLLYLKIKRILIFGTKVSDYIKSILLITICLIFFNYYLSSIEVLYEIKIGLLFVVWIRIFFFNLRLTENFIDSEEFKFIKSFKLKKIQLLLFILFNYFFLNLLVIFLYFNLTYIIFANIFLCILSSIMFTIIQILFVLTIYCILYSNKKSVKFIFLFILFYFFTLDSNIFKFFYEIDTISVDDFFISIFKFIGEIPFVEKFYTYIIFPDLKQVFFNTLFFLSYIFFISKIFLIVINKEKTRNNRIKKTKNIFIYNIKFRKPYMAFFIKDFMINLRSTKFIILNISFLIIFTYCIFKNHNNSMLFIGIQIGYILSVSGYLTESYKQETKMIYMFKTMIKTYKNFFIYKYLNSVFISFFVPCIFLLFWCIYNHIAFVESLTIFFILLFFQLFISFVLEIVSFYCIDNPYNNIIPIITILSLAIFFPVGIIILTTIFVKSINRIKNLEV